MRYLVAALVLLAVQFVPGAGAGDVQAQTFACNSSGTSNVQPGCLSREQAYAECRAAADAYPSEVVSCAVYGSPSGYQCYGSSFHACTPAAYRYFPFPTANGGCPAGSAWDEGSKTCFSSAQCLAHNAEPGFKDVGIVTKPFYERCVGGCEYKAKPGSGIVHVDGADYDLVTGEFEFTGNACAAELPVEEASNIQNPNPQECIPQAGGGDFPLCVKNNGEQCLTAPRTGNQFCWKPGETGEKVGGAQLQKRNAGTSANTPTTPPPENSQFVADGTPVTTETTINNTTINTTISNWKTDTGVDAGPVDQSEKPDGSGDPASPDEGKDGSVTGGVDCDAPPQVDNGDPLLANIILQTWGTRCAAESLNAVHSTGDINDCAQAFTVEGPEGDPNIAKLKAMRAEICPNEMVGVEGEAGATGDYGLGTDAEEATLKAGMVQEGEEQGGDGLDDSGWGFARTCPQVPTVDVMGVTLDFNRPELCDWMKMGGQLVLLLAALASLKILAGVGGS